MGDAEQISNQARGSAPPAAMDGATTDNVRHHEEVIHEAFCLDDFEFLDQPFFNRVGTFLVPPGYSFPARFAELADPVAFPHRKDKPAAIPVGKAIGCKFTRIVHRLNAIGKVNGHVPFRLQQPSRIGKFFLGNGVEGPVQRHGPSQLVRRIVVPVDEMNRVGCNGRNARFTSVLKRTSSSRTGQDFHIPVDLSIQRLKNDRIGTKNRHIFRANRKSEGDASDGLITKVKRGNDIRKNLVPLGCFGQGRQRLSSGTEMHPHHGTQLVTVGSIEKIPKTVESVVVREGDAVETQLDGGPTEILRRMHAAHHGIKGMYPEMNETRHGSLLRCGAAPADHFSTEPAADAVHGRLKAGIFFSFPFAEKRHLANRYGEV